MQAQNETADGFVIIIRGAAGPAVRAAFEDMELTVANDTTVLHRSSGDQAALHGKILQFCHCPNELRRMEHLR
jgi:hypothetical protein